MAAPDLTGQVAIVTGSALGIGRGIAVALGRSGAMVACLDIDTTENAVTTEQVEAAGGAAIAFDCDVTDRARARAIVDDITERHGRIDILVNNVAIWVDTSLTGGDFDQQCDRFERSVDACTVAAFHCTAAVVPVMRRTGGNVINMLTDHVKPAHMITHLVGASGYDVAKFGLWRLTETWAVELAPLGIRVNGLCFGATDTPMLRGVSEAKAAAGMQPSDLGDAVLNLLAHGPDGPTGTSPLFGLTDAPLERSKAEIAALAPS